MIAFTEIDFAALGSSLDALFAEQRRLELEAEAHKPCSGGFVQRLREQMPVRRGTLFVATISRSDRPVFVRKILCRRGS